MNAQHRNYSTISPSAKSLLLMKSFTNIPFAKEAAGLMLNSEAYKPDTETKDLSFWLRANHFENRYWSIDQLLSGLGMTNVLELSSGYSFRGLDMVTHDNIHYIDTDLDEVIALKKKVITMLQPDEHSFKGRLQLLPLNALDERQFDETVNQFPAGEIIIVNEGLLMYLNAEEKEQLCQIISRILKRRGGYWITADIYLKKDVSKRTLITHTERTKHFFEEHQIEEHKFDSFQAAEAFFTKAGFIVDQEAETNHSTLSSLTHMLKNATHEQLLKIRNADKIQTTWRLRIP
jgi:O-methyltransferase involved in polyketide biosynthesis